jgi:benzoylformate decarboxylase
VAVSGGQAELVQLAETIGARVHSSFAAELPFPSAHPLYAGLLNVVSTAALKGQLSVADVIFAVGTPVLPLLFPIDESPFPDGAKVIHIDLDAWEIGKNWPVDIGIVADPRLAIADILAALRRTMTDSHREAASQRAAAVETTNGQLLQAMEGAAKARWDTSPMSAGRLMAEMGGAMLPDTVLFDESITSGGYLMRYLRFSETGRHYRAIGGGLGPGMPNPIGIKLARPDRPVLSVIGDGAALYTIQALWTAAHHKVPSPGWWPTTELPHLKAQHARIPRRGRRPPVHGDGHDGPGTGFSQIAAAFGVKVRCSTATGGDAIREARSRANPGSSTP